MFNDGQVRQQIGMVDAIGFVRLKLLHAARESSPCRTYCKEYST